MKSLVLVRVSLFLTAFAASLAGQSLETRVLPISRGWAKNQINAVIFRRNSITTHNDSQYAAFYDEFGRVVLARRKLSSNFWQIHPTQYVGDVNDAHRSISIAIDGAGYLHMAWNQHDSKLQYCRSLKSQSTDLSAPLQMLGNNEDRVTYPEFYNLPDGDLIFLYRDGSSGKGNLVLNRYSIRTRSWIRLQDKLIDGEGRRSAYWQATVDASSRIHLSWVWRETPDVASNHDICYAVSSDGGKTWQNSAGEPYKLPITASAAEYVVHIPQNSDLINQTSMTTDSQGHPFIVTYWREAQEKVPQYQLIFHDGRMWKISQITRRVSEFSLAGLGTRRIPISRPQIVVDSESSEAVVIFRDEERGNRISLARSNLRALNWTIEDLTKYSVGLWEPTLDSMAWNRFGKLYLLVERVGQGEGESLEEIPPQLISILEWRPARVK